MKVRIIEKEGKWYFESSTPKNTCLIPMKTKELAQELLDLHNKYYRKYILLDDDEITERVRVNNVGLLYENGEDNPPTHVLYIRHKNATWRVFERICKLDDNQNKE